MTDSTSTIVTQLLSDYKDFVTGSVVTASDYQNATRVLSCVFNTILAEPTPTALTAIWNFFVENQNGVLQENIALYGVGVLNQNDRAVYNLIYTMFRQATNGLQPAMLGTALAILVRAPILVEFLREEAILITPGQELPASPDTGVTTSTIVTGADTTKGFVVNNGVLSFNDTAMQTYILSLLSSFMAQAPNDPRSLSAADPWNNGGNLAFIRSGP